MSVRKIILEPGYSPYYVSLLAGLMVLLTRPKGTLVIWLNGHHSPFLDLFFKYWTHLGDGIVFFIFIFLLLMVSYSKAIMVAAAGISQTVIVQVLKRFVFSEVDRPSLYMDNFDSLYHIPGIEFAGLYSFPSGHTASAFTLTMLLSLFYRNSYLTGLLMILAILVGISRMYLLQHFLIDVYVGSVIGFLNGLLIYSWIQASALGKNRKLNGGLLRN